MVAVCDGNPFNGIERYFKRGDFPFTKGKRIRSMELKECVRTPSVAGHGASEESVQWN